MVVTRGKATNPSTTATVAPIAKARLRLRIATKALRIGAAVDGNDSLCCFGDAPAQDVEQGGGQTPPPIPPNPIHPMRIPFLCTVAALLSGLPAQELPPRTLPLSLPSAADVVPPTTAVLREAAASAQVGGEAAKRVQFDRPRADGPLWALGRAWKGSFDGQGFTVIPFFGTNAPQNFPLRLQLAQATVGGEPLPLVDGEPVVTDTTVRTARGSLTEVIDTQLDSLEQSFVFDSLPNRGAIAVDVRITSDLVPTPIANGLRFANEYGHVDYTKAIAVDAKGQRLPLDIVWTGSCAHMEIPAAFVEQAQLPIVLDPILNYWFALASGIAQLQHDSDVASIQASSLGGRTLLIWQRQWSVTDQDCFGLMFDGNLGLVQTDFIIDFTTEDWGKVAVAGNNYAQNFLVVAEIRIPVFLGSVWFIGGRGVSASAAVGGVFNIERDGVVGLPGNNFHPDVGSDPYYGVGRYTVVFNKRSGFTSDIYYKQVTSAYGLVTTNPIALDLSTNDESKPSISKSCGQSNGLAANWFVTWQRTYPSSPFDQEVYGRYITWNGAVAGSEFGIGLTIGEETAPSPSSPIDANGVRYWPVCYEYTSTLGQPRDILCRLYRGDGGLQANFTVSNNVPGSDDRDPEVDSDGTRFVTCFTTGTSGYPQGVEGVTSAFLWATNSFRVDDRSGLLTSSLDNYGQCNISADFSGGSGMSPRYFLSFSEQASNTFRLEVFGGYLGGTFFTTRASQCGSLPISVSGSPVIGQTVTVTVGNGPLSGTILGVPGFIPLNVLGCNCWQGVDQGVYLGNPLVWTVPNNPAYVGIVLSAQGWTIVGSQCLGFVDLSDTIDFTVR